MLKLEEKADLKAAQNMIDRYGGDALAEVDLRIAELRMQKQLDALKLWENIRKAVIFLLDKPTDETLH